EMKTDLARVMGVGGKRHPGALSLFTVDDVANDVFAGALDPVDLDTRGVDIYFFRQGRYGRNEVRFFQGYRRRIRRVVIIPVYGYDLVPDGLCKGPQGDAVGEGRIGRRVDGDLGENMICRVGEINLVSPHILFRVVVPRQMYKPPAV